MKHGLGPYTTFKCIMRYRLAFNSHVMSWLRLGHKKTCLGGNLGLFKSLGTLEFYLRLERVLKSWPCLFILTDICQLIIVLVECIQGSYSL